MAFAATSPGYGERTPTARSIEAKGKRRTEGAMRRFQTWTGMLVGGERSPSTSSNAAEGALVPLCRALVQLLIGRKPVYVIPDVGLGPSHHGQAPTRPPPSLREKRARTSIWLQSASRQCCRSDPVASGHDFLFFVVINSILLHLNLPENLRPRGARTLTIWLISDAAPVGGVVFFSNQ